MALNEGTQLVAAVAGALASVVAAVDQRLIRRLRREGATTSAAAVELAGLRPLSRWRLARLRASGAIVPGGAGRVYLDEAAYGERRRRRRKAAITVVATALVAFAVWYVVLR